MGWLWKVSKIENAGGLGGEALPGVSGKERRKTDGVCGALVVPYIHTSPPNDSSTRRFAT